MVALPEGESGVNAGDGAVPVVEFQEDGGLAAAVEAEAVVLGEAGSSVEVSVAIRLEG